MKLINNVLFYYYNLVFVQYVYFLQTKATTSDLNFFFITLYIHSDVDSYNFNFSYNYYYGFF